MRLACSVLLAALALGCVPVQAEPQSVHLAPVAAPRAPEPPHPPPGYVEVKVMGIEPQRHGGAAVLVGREDKRVVVPIYVGESEGLSIGLRKKGEHYQRPLTHDLLDAVMRELGGQLVKVQIDDLRNNTYIGSIFVRSGERVVELDARPSDAIALALGAHVPIYCSSKVIERAGKSPDAPGDEDPQARAVP